MIGFVCGLIHVYSVFYMAKELDYARFFALYGNTPATCYGPEATSIHTVDESVSLRSLRDVTCVLALFIAGWCGLEAKN